VVLDRDELRNVTLDDRQLMGEILWALIDDASRHAGMLESTLKEANGQRSMRVARHAARACANLGANATAEAFQAVARHAGSREFDACRSSMAVVRAEIERLREEASRV
jgi:HPt (histidine-containing phosphotransfer) domain-containing protein